MSGRVDAMRRALDRTWYPFFARFPRPTEVQLEAWSPLLAGHDCLVMAATATGKTEAAVAPLLERHLPRLSSARPGLLLVCPTRALVNDLSRRLERPLARLGLRLHRRTGDHPTLPRRGAQVLVTTPESLDSLMVRHTRFLGAVRAALLDELHILDTSTRGDQLAMLMARLRSLRRGRLQGVVTSATIHDPDGIAGRYLRSARQVRVNRPPRLETRWEYCPRRGDLLALLGSVWGGGGARKVLVFVDRRADVEDLASRARLGPRVYAHHGSLSRSERERVEARFLTDPSAICFATMTLELGIDIGDVDLVVQVGPPGSVASLLQRVGRGNRRSGRARLLGAYRDEGELARFTHLASLAAALELCAEPYCLRPSVLVQQAGSLLLQSPGGWITAEVLHQRLPRFVRRTCDVPRLERLLEDLARVEWLKPGRAGRFHAGSLLHRAFELRQLHANLAPEPGGLEVVDETTGQTLGEVAAVGPRGQLALGGRDRQVVRSGEGQIFVKARGAEAGSARFAPRGQPVMSRCLARSLAQYLALPPGPLFMVDHPRGVSLMHFSGSLAGELLARFLQQAHRWPVVRDRARGRSLGLLLELPPPADSLPPIAGHELRRQAESDGRQLARLAQAGPYHKLLPVAWQHQLLESLLPYEELARAWSRAPIVSEPPEGLEPILRCLALG